MDPRFSAPVGTLYDRMLEDSQLAAEAEAAIAMGNASASAAASTQMNPGHASEGPASKIYRVGGDDIHEQMNRMLNMMMSQQVSMMEVAKAAAAAASAAAEALQRANINSGQLAPQAEALATAVAAVIPAVMQPNLQPPKGAKKLHEKVVQCIEKQGLRLDSDVMKLTRAERRCRKCEDDIQMMNGTAKCPKGIRPFTSSPTNKELDNQWKECAASPVTFKVEIPQGKTKREAMALVHHAMHRWFRMLEKEAAADAAVELKASAGPAEFFRRCDTAISEWKAKEESLDNTGVTAKVDINIDISKVKERIEEEYVKILKKRRLKD